MEKEKRNYVEELENLKTAFIGYDKEAVLTYIPVSYTHLDVYKRQGEESAFCDRDDYAFLHSIIVFADLQCRIDESAAVEKGAVLIKLQVACLHLDIK